MHPADWQVKPLGEDPLDEATLNQAMARLDALEVELMDAKNTVAERNTALRAAEEVRQQLETKLSDAMKDLASMRSTDKEREQAAACSIKRLGHVLYRRALAWVCVDVHSSWASAWAGQSRACRFMGGWLLY